jgi:predicted amidohydrolase
MNTFNQTSGTGALTFSLLLTLAFGGTSAHGAEPPPPPEQTVRIAGIVLKWVRADKEANYRRCEPLIREAAAKGAKIVCTTECFLDGYAIADQDIPLATYLALGEEIPSGSYYKRLASLARELKIHLVAGMVEADGNSRYNTAVFVGPDGRLLGKYRKQKIGFEDYRNRAGGVSSVFESPFGKVGILICADRTHPEVVRSFCTNGAIFLLCASGGSWGVLDNDLTVQARSRENHIHIVFVHPAEFLVTAPDGSILQRRLLGEGLLVTRTEVNGAKDRNQVFYHDLPIHRNTAAGSK